MNLNQAQLDKRNKELDAREEFIDTKAKILKEAPITFKVYDARVKASEDRLENLGIDIKLAADKLHNLQYNLDTFVVNSKRRREDLTKELNDLQISIDEATKTLQSLQYDEKSIEKQIAERKKYLKDQEDTINTTIEKGNETLLDLNDEILRQKQTNKQLQSDHIQLKTDYDEAIIEINTKKANRLRELEELEMKKRNLNQEIGNLTKLVQAASNEYKKVTEDTSKKLNQLKEMETSLTTKRDALVLERQELETDKRRWNSTKIQYEI